MVTGRRYKRNASGSTNAIITEREYSRLQPKAFIWLLGVVLTRHLIGKSRALYRASVRVYSCVCVRHSAHFFTPFSTRLEIVELCSASRSNCIGMAHSSRSGYAYDCACLTKMDSVLYKSVFLKRGFLRLYFYMYI